MRKGTYVEEVKKNRMIGKDRNKGSEVRKLYIRECKEEIAKVLGANQDKRRRRGNRSRRVVTGGVG